MELTLSEAWYLRDCIDVDNGEYTPSSVNLAELRKKLSEEIQNLTSAQQAE